MQKFLYPFSVALALLLVSCHETRDTQIGEDVSQFKQVGAEIPLETGLRWMDLYKSKAKESGRFFFPNYSASAETINSMTNSVTNLVGVAFHHAIDGNGSAHILALPIDESLSLWPVTTSRTVVDLNSGTAISEEEAKAWTDRYSDAHPQEIWFHFFGRHVFQAISELSFFDKLNVVPAIKDTDMSPQLLLIIWNNELSASGRSKVVSGAIYDASNPCPPCPVR